MDLRKRFPDMQGFSARNLLFMRKFAEEYRDAQKVKQLVSQLPCCHVVRLARLRKCAALGHIRGTLRLPRFQTHAASNVNRLPTYGRTTLLAMTRSASATKTSPVQCIGMM
jgi:hypothetical protein